MALHLFEAFGIELEYMIVDRETLSVRPISDFVLKDEQGVPVSDLDHGSISWSNELTHHVIEVKTNGPAPSLEPLAAQFQQNVQHINQLLVPAGARLLPTAMHPWMNPDLEMKLWPHEYHAVYETFDKIFDCRGHGWANLQSMHINLPFADDAEFGRLHAAIRLILPLLPALAASSPFKDGLPTGLMDSRLDVYRRNAKGFTSIAGRIIPEQAFTQADYDQQIFQPMFRDIAPYDPDEVLRDEFLNSRGAIARFSRGAIEIRVIDVQECPQADLAIAALTIGVLQLLVDQTWTSTAEQQSITIDDLEPSFLAAIDHAELGIVENEKILQQFGMDVRQSSLKDVWVHLYEAVSRAQPDFARQHGSTIEILLNEGCLSRRILSVIGSSPGQSRLQDVYRSLASCLDAGILFRV